MDLDFPRITIGLTCYNAEHTIERALLSALAQDWPELEVVVVDDASADHSWDIIQQYATRDPRIKALRHAINQGPAAARNTILKKASSAVLVFFDDDDESYPDRLRTQYAALCSHEKLTGAHLIACYASGRRRYSNGYELELPAIGSRPRVPVGEEVADYLLFNGRNDTAFYGSGIPTCALAARVTTFNAIGGFDANLRRVEDADFAIRLALAGGHFIGCPSPLFLQHATIAADKSPRMNMQAEQYLIDKYADYLTRKGRYHYARAWFRIRFYHFSGRRFRFLMALLLFLMRYPRQGFKHLRRSAPGRLRHESSMRSKLNRTKPNQATEAVIKRHD